MKITDIQTLHVDAGWRPWTFIKISTDGGVTGWSECTDSHGAPRGIEGVVMDLKPLLLGEDPQRVEKLYWEMYSRTRQSPGSIIQKAIGGIENALLDIQGKALGVPVAQLFGGPIREKLPLYWSHCVTSRVRAYEIVKKPQVKTLDDVKKMAEEIKASGFKTIKTNMAILGEQPYVYMPGFFKSAGGPELNATPEIVHAVEEYIATLRAALGDEIGIALDLNFNFKTEGYIKMGRALEKYHLAWLEIDTYDPFALRQIKDALKTPVVSCENLYGTRQYKPFFEAHAADSVSIDVIWNGFKHSLDIAAMAEAYEMNVSPHNYNGHLSTMISAQFCAAIPNFKIMEVDVDDVPWREELFTNIPKIENGNLILTNAPGWGTDVVEEVARQHPWPKA